MVKSEAKREPRETRDALLCFKAVGGEWMCVYVVGEVSGSFFAPWLLPTAS